jgi:uncharacterized protein (DUF2267 family)
MNWNLDIGILQKNGLNDRKEASDLTEAVHQTLYDKQIMIQDIIL